MEISDLRVALTSGNYNMVRDGANAALNRLVGFLLKEGAAVRVYAPTIKNPAFEPTGDLVSVPAIPIPTRTEYRVAMGLYPKAKRDLHRFAPNMIHISVPEFLGAAAVNFGRRNDVPAVGSVHTRFDTYPRYYNLAFTEPVLTAIMRNVYRRCDAIFAPSESMAQILRDERMNYNVGIWSRGVDRDLFAPAKRDLEWRRSHGIDDNDVVVGFFGRIVMEKGLDVFWETIEELTSRGVRHRVLVVGDGPARPWFEQMMPQAVFTGFQSGQDLGRAIASMDVLLNPSITETFGNVTLEAMASGLAVVAADATGADSLVVEGTTGHLVPPGAVGKFADCLQHYIEDAGARAAAGAAGDARADRYSWDAINGALAKSYLRIIRARAVRTKRKRG